jgi:hypothetical protein
MDTKKTAILIVVGILILASVFIFFVFSRNNPGVVTTSVATSSTPSVTMIATTTESCLPSDEYSGIPTNEESNTYYGWPNSSTIDVYVKNRTTSEIVSTFQIQNVVYRAGDALKIYPCGIYVIKGFGEADEPGYTTQLWEYNYAGVGKELFTFFVEGPNYTEQVNNYYPDFSVDSDEKHLALEQAPGEASDSLVIDDTKTLQNLFTLPISSVLEKNSNIAGSVEFEPGGWSTDGRYFWFDFFQDADVLGFVRIDTANWSYQAFVAPQVTMGGDAFNPDTGMTTYSTDVAPWTGDTSIDQQYRDQAQQSGQITSFYIYDLLTNQNYLVATTSDPTYYFQPQWISDAVLQYTLPSGATTTYSIP